MKTIIPEISIKEIFKKQVSENGNYDYCYCYCPDCRCNGLKINNFSAT